MSVDGAVLLAAAGAERTSTRRAHASMATANSATVVWRSASSRRIGFHFQEHGALLHRGPRLDCDAPDDAVDSRAQLVLHLHRLDHHETLSRAHLLARGDIDAHDEPG